MKKGLTKIQPMDLILKKSVYLYEYIDNWQRFNEMFLPDKKEFTAAWQWMISRMLTKNTRKKSGKSTMIYMCKAIHYYQQMSTTTNATANNKFMKGFNQNKESSYNIFWNVSNLCAWKMLQKLPINDFGWRKELFRFNEESIQTKTMKTVTKDIYLKFMLITLKNCKNNIANSYLFLKMHIDQRKKLVRNMHDNNNYVTHIRALKQALDHGLILEKLHRVIQFN